MHTFELAGLQTVHLSQMVQDGLVVDAPPLRLEYRMDLAITVDSSPLRPDLLDGGHQVRVQRPWLAWSRLVVPATIGQSHSLRRLRQRHAVLGHQSPCHAPLVPNPGRPASFFGRR